MDIDKFVHENRTFSGASSFGSLMDIDKFVLETPEAEEVKSFGSLMDIDKFVLKMLLRCLLFVSVL